MRFLKIALNYIKLLLENETYYRNYRQLIFYVLNNLKHLFGENFILQLMLTDSIRYLVVVSRYIYFGIILGQLTTHENYTEAVSPNTVKYNLTAITNLGLLERTRVLIRPFSVIETLTPESNILVVGPRTEDDLLHLMAYGFKKVRGLDLISYSPYIDLGDMHKMPYGNDVYDAVILGWVLVYSDEPVQAAQEVIRVAKNGAIIGIGAEHHPDLEEYQLKQQTIDTIGYSIGGKRINTALEHLYLFGDFVDEVYFIHDIGSMRPDFMSNTCIIFSIKK